MSASLFIGMPCHRGQLRVETCAGICASMQAAAKVGMPIEFRDQSNITAIELARNILVADFLSTTHDHLLMVDDDIGFKWFDVERLLDANADIASGVYPYKAFGITATCVPLKGPRHYTRNHIRDRGMVLCEYLPAGFLMIKRHVIEAIADHLMRLGEEPSEYVGRQLPRIFRTYYCPDRKQTVGEDYAFSKLARECGFDLYSHFDVVLRHFGTHAYALDETNLAMSNAAARSHIPVTRRLA